MAACKKPGTFIEFSKGFVDQLHAWYATSPEHRPGKLTNSTYGVHFYDSIVVVEKRQINKPFELLTGAASFPIDAQNYIRLAEHHARKGNLTAAIYNCQEAIKIDPALPDARNILSQLEAEFAKSRPPVGK